MFKKVFKQKIDYAYFGFAVDNQSAFLIFSSRHEIRMIDLSAPDIQPVLVPSLRNTIAIDFLYDAGENGRQLVRE